MLFLNSVRVAPGVRSALAVACGWALLAPSSAWSAGDEVGPVVVTATRGTTRISQVVADVTVIDSARLKQAAGQTLMSLLAEEPGLQFASNGGLGKSGSVYIRGGESRHTLLLIDGVRYGSATLGQPILENLPLDAIDHIEIVRGPMSALYGSDAAAGVIQIFTKRGKQGWAPYASLAVGTDNLLQGAVGMSGGQGDLTYNLGVQAQGTSGFSSTNPRAPYGNYSPDRDGFVQQSMTLGGSYKIASDWKVDASFLRSRGVSEFDDGVSVSDPTRGARSNLDSMVASASLFGQLTEQWGTGLKVANSEDISNTTEAVNDWNLGSFRTRQAQIAWENHLGSPVGEWLIALERTRQAVDSTTVTYDVQQRWLNAVVLGLSGDAGPHVWQVSARRDENSQFGGENTGSVAYGYQLTSAWRLGGSLGTSFVAPSFNQLYYPDYGNASLRPERGVNRELNLRFGQGDTQARAAWFDNRIRSFIQAGQDAANVPHVRMSGLSLSAGSAWATPAGKLTLSGSYDWLTAINQETEKRLPLRARQTALLKASLSQDSLSYGVTLKGRGGTYADAANTDAARLPGYGLIGLNAQWRLDRAWSLGGRVDNLTDRAHETQLGYNQPGRQFVVTLNYAPGSR